VDLAHRRFLRDQIASFFSELATAIRSGGAKQWITSDFMGGSNFASDAKINAAINFSGLNAYSYSSFTPTQWSELTREFDASRSSLGDGRFFVAETQANRLGGDQFWDGLGNSAAARMNQMLPIAYGSVGLMYWSGNRFSAGPWPLWSGLLDLQGDPEIDFPIVQKVGSTLAKWGPQLVATRVNAKAAILTDFDQRAAHWTYPYTAGDVGETATTEYFEAFHRLGIGVDQLSATQARNADRLETYDIIVVSAASVLDEKDVLGSLKSFVQRGGTIIVTPLTANFTADGTLRRDLAAKGLAGLTGTGVRSEWLVPFASTKVKPTVTVGTMPFILGGEGYCEILSSLDGSSRVVSRFNAEGLALDAQPAIMERKLGKGTIYKLAFWPDRSALSALIRALKPIANGVFRNIAEPSIHAVPRDDGSMFIINTGQNTATIDLVSPRRDRLTGRSLATGLTDLPPYAVIWAE
jgi:beta-galactosidase